MDVTEPSTKRVKLSESAASSDGLHPDIDPDILKNLGMPYQPNRASLSLSLSLSLILYVYMYICMYLLSLSAFECACQNTTRKFKHHAREQ